MVLSPDREDDKLIKTWRRSNLLVKRCQVMPGRSCRRCWDIPFSLVLTPKHSWHSICHPQPPAFISTHLPLQQFKYNLQWHKRPGQPFVGFCAALSPSWPYPARLRGAVPQPPLLCTEDWLWPCGNTENPIQRASSSMTKTPEKLGMILEWSGALLCHPT